MLITVGAIALTLGLVIFVHELGHFLAAKLTGTGAPRFSIGFGPATPFRWTWRGTEFVLAWIPLGGYVKLATREDDDPAAAIEGDLPEEYPDDQLFENKSLAARGFIMSAGVMMNMVLAVGLNTGVALAVGGAEDPTTRAVVRPELLPAGAEALATVPAGTPVLWANGDTVTHWGVVNRALIDMASDRVRLDFAGRDALILEIPGTDQARAALLEGLQPAWEPRIGQIVAGSPAHAAGITPGDVVVRAAGDSIRYWPSLVGLVEARAGDTVEFVIRRGDSLLTFAIVPEATEVTGVAGETRTVGKIGAAPQPPVTYRRLGALGAVTAGLDDTWNQLRSVGAVLRGLFVGRVSPRELGGPIAIGQISGQVARSGLVPLLAFIAFISVNLAVFNLLPVPVLDGGHLVFLTLEGMLGRPVSLAVRYRLTQVGMMLLLLLVVFVFYNDIRRLVGL